MRSWAGQAEAISAKTEIRQDEQDDDDQADDVDDGVHDFLWEMVDAPVWAPSEP
jgi:hypothetical protein